MKNLTLMTLMCILTFSFIGCDSNDGKAEKLGESVDEAMDTTQDKLEEAGDKVKDTLDNAAKDIEEVCEKTTEKNC